MDPNFVLLYVENPEVSRRFYGSLLGAEPLEASPNWAMFGLKSGVMLGLWARREVEPRPQAPAGAAELGFPLADEGEVRNLHARWKSDGIPIIQEPQTMDFGFTFTALDPDGHRIRVFAPGGR